MADPQQPSPSDQARAADAAYRAAVQKYGSDKVAQPCDEERLYIEASRGIAPQERETLRALARKLRPLPATIAEAWDEWSYIDRRDQVKREFHPERGVCPAMAERAALLAEMLVAQFQASDLADLDYRLRLLAALSAGSRPGLDAAMQQKLAQTLRTDIARLKAVLHPSQPQQVPAKLGSARQRRAAVLAQLRDPESSRWSDREIARACGVSPQTVSNWRRKLSLQKRGDGPERRERFYRRGGSVHRMKVRRIGGKRKKPDLDF